MTELLEKSVIIIAGRNGRNHEIELFEDHHGPFYAFKGSPTTPEERMVALLATGFRYSPGNGQEFFS